jgi:LPXTG-motif cell wall-anchored protein
MVGTYIQITADPEDVTVNGTMRIYYSSQQLATLGISEDNLKIYYWDATASSWATAETHVNTAEHCAWTVVNHLSTWALLAQPTQALWEQPWFIISIVVVIIAILAGAALVLRRKRRSPQKTKTAGATDSPSQ